MDCATARDEILDVMYGEATETARRRAEEHLAACADCRAEQAGLRRVRSDLQAWTLPASLAAPRRGWRAVNPSVLAWAASLLLAFGGGLLVADAAVARTESRVQRLLAEQEQRHRAEMTAIQARSALPSDDVLRHVQRLVAESEARQAERIEAQLVDLNTRVDRSRRDDMARISAGMALLEGQTSHDLARATELMGYVLQAAHEPR